MKKPAMAKATPRPARTVTEMPLWLSEDHLRLFLRGVRTKIAVGAYAHERGRKQALILEADIWVKLRRKYDNRALSAMAAIVDYSKLHHLATVVWPRRSHTPFLEPLAEEALALALKPAAVVAARVSICKTELYENCDAIGLEMFRVKKTPLHRKRRRS